MNCFLILQLIKCTDQFMKTLKGLATVARRSVSFLECSWVLNYAVIFLSVPWNIRVTWERCHWLDRLKPLHSNQLTNGWCCTSHGQQRIQSGCSICIYLVCYVLVEFYCFELVSASSEFVLKCNVGVCCVWISWVPTDWFYCCCFIFYLLQFVFYLSEGFLRSYWIITDSFIFAFLQVNTFERSAKNQTIHLSRYV